MAEWKLHQAGDCATTMSTFLPLTDLTTSFAIHVLLISTLVFDYCPQLARATDQGSVRPHNEAEQDQEIFPHPPSHSVYHRYRDPLPLG